jgi:hypothetical protein
MVMQKSRQFIIHFFAAATIGMCAFGASAQTTGAGIEVLAGVAPSDWATVDRLGVQNGYIIVRFAVNNVVHPTGTVPGTNGSTCLFGNFYMDLTLSYSKAMHQQLMLAKATNKRISRAMYTQVVKDGICTIWLLEQSE